MNRIVQPQAWLAEAAGLARRIGRALKRMLAALPGLAARRRHVLKYYGRRPLAGLPTGVVSTAASESIGASLVQAGREPLPLVMARMGAPEDGLSAAEAGRRLARDGPNVVAHEPSLPGLLRLWQNYLNPFNVLLTTLACLSWLSGDVRAAAVVSLMICLSTCLRFIQEARSHSAAASLRALVGNTATVIRRAAPGPGAPGRHEVPVDTLVAGDQIALAAGDMVPADCRLLSARDLFVSQSAMTGESLPTEKFVDAAFQTTNPLDQNNLVLMGTSVASGAATALVLATGSRTYFGTLAASVVEADETPNAFQAGVNGVSWLLIRFGAVMVPVVFLINGWTKGNWLEAFLFAVSVAVGLTPEMLPMIVTSTLARGAVQLAHKKLVVKRLDAIQNFGAMDVLCADKTGTLTQDRIAIASATDAFGNPWPEVLELAFLNSYYQTGLKNLLDDAVLDHVELAAELRLEQRYRKIDELPFDFVRRRMSVVVSEDRDHHALICKGALDEMLSVCTRVRRVDGQRTGARTDLPLDAAAMREVREHARRLNMEGLRIIAVATKALPPTQQVYAVADEAAMTLAGFIAFLDPPKDSAAPALAALARHGVRVKVLTGDNELVLTHVCAQVGLAPGPVLLG